MGRVKIAPLVMAAVPFQSPMNPVAPLGPNAKIVNIARCSLYRSPVLGAAAHKRAGLNGAQPELALTDWREPGYKAFINHRRLDQARKALGGSIT